MKLVKTDQALEYKVVGAIPLIGRAALIDRSAGQDRGSSSFGQLSLAENRLGPDISIQAQDVWVHRYCRARNVLLARQSFLTVLDHPVDKTLNYPLARSNPSSERLRCGDLYSLIDITIYC